MQILCTKNQISEMNTVVEVYRNKLRQVRLNINLFWIRNRKTTSAISRYDSIFQERNIRVFSQDKTINGSTTKRYQIYINKDTRTDVSRNEEYISSIKDIKELWFKEKKTFVKVNVSNKAIEECLYQDLKRKIVSYYSRKLSSTEQNYTIGNKEMLVIISILQNWKTYVQRINQQIVILFDHNNLQKFKTV